RGTCNVRNRPQFAPPFPATCRARHRRAFDGGTAAPRVGRRVAAECHHAAGRAARAKAQYPIASILSCADSRVAPELMFDQAPGDLFVVRIAGNYLNLDALSSLEYGVGVLGTPLVLVLGHSNCGAVKAAIQEIQDPKPLPGHIWDITNAVRPGIENVVKGGGDGLLERAIDANVAYNASRVASAQPIIAEAVKSQRVRVIGAEYELATGKVRLLNG